MKLKCISVLLVTLIVSACKVELYTGLGEQEGNEMLALLLSEGISASKTNGKGNTITLEVSESQLTQAMELLSQHSYPRQQYATINEVFPQGGLIQSEQAEKARYRYAMSQDLAATISNIDGVITARVHLVIPEKAKGNKRLQMKETESAKASVFIKHNQSATIEPYIPQIKTMVANAVPELNYENITIAVFPSMPNYRTGN
ncbi:type III secretion system inner membrane ring lipoprotein SctJ [Pleionea sediminis]|uniref:type III secretion system inner membrane ring lipoprotein SctJ n=1 Tax=Pleionea sediminis TaxID=2569479 RepID=UPI00118505C9|nr:type III secretion inner membrane ring lipoprotein SctJ [Pleionea sediminis]